ncbi:glycosyl hydrolase [Kiritimatiella glycovorans]|uniref:Glycosyl hydrolases family 2, sugar binding domain n=1 Tax=Kiritimatiella glycovorans TaxID=1307763 RepID=A0A0G3ECY5_9BACT|nr:glycosyl hydrolase [Kiritimatiella glycovorans]AKJ64173.1 Glycosyl hydrolases family 2, sugar binding domain [Kiritimatiella glycovorans]
MKTRKTTKGIFSVAVVLVAGSAFSPEPVAEINTEHERNQALMAKIDGAQSVAETLAALKEGWNNPPATYRPHTRWWWPGNAVTKEGITWHLEQMKEKGLGGVEIMSYGNVYQEGNIPFDSPEFIEMVKYTVDECRRLGMEVTPPLNPGWGHGSSNTPEDEKAMGLVYSEVDVEGGALAMELPLPKDGYGKIMPKRFEALVAVALGADGTPDPSRRFDLTDQVTGDRAWTRDPQMTIEAELPPGKWHLLAFWNCKTGQKCAGENYEPRSWLIDHLSYEAAQNHAGYMGGKYRQAFGADFGQTVDSMFGDSYEVAHGIAFWTHGLFDRFEREKGYDLRPYLPLALYDGAPETPYVRHDIGQFLHEAGMEGIVAGLADWCAEAGVDMRQQPHYRFTTDIIAASGVFQRPETENTKTSFEPTFWHKLTTSGAWLYPSDRKKWVSCEAFTFINHQYRTSMDQIKRGSDLFLRDGVTQFYNHGYFYTPEKEIAPSRDLLWGNRISHVSPWWPWYRGLADYQARACFLSRQGRAEADVLVYAPYPSTWSERFKHPAREVRDLPFGHLPKTLVANGYDFDFANDDLLLNHAEIRDGKIVINGYDYAVLILPRVLCLAPETLEKIGQFVQAGGTVFALDTLPETSGGLIDHEARDTRLAGMLGRLFATGGGEKAVGRGTTWFMPDCDGFEYLTKWAGVAGAWDPVPTPPLSPAYERFITALKARLTPDFEMADKAQSDGLTFRRTVIGDVDCWFIVNLQPAPRQTEITLKTQGKFPQTWDAMTGEIGGVDGYRFAEDGRLVVSVDLEPWESRFILCSPEEVPAEPRPDVEPLMEISGPWQLSVDGQGGLETEMELPALTDLATLPVLEHFSGTATYRTEFRVPEVKFPIILDLGEVGDVATVIVNGKEAGKAWMPPYRVDVSELVKPGVNELTVVVANVLWNHVIGLEEPKPIPADLHAHYGQTRNLDYRGWARLQRERVRQSKVRLPSGLMGPVRLETTKPVAGK